MSVADDFDGIDEQADHKGGRIFGVVFDPRTYGAILYMLLALPLGVGYFTFVAVGLSLSVGLMILIIGVLVALLFLAMTRGLSTVEGFITQALLGARIEHWTSDTAEIDVEDNEASDEPAQISLWTRIKGMFTDARTWTSMIYMALMLPLGVGYFTLAVTGFTIALSFMLAPIASIFVDNVHVMEVAASDPEFLQGLSELANSPVGMILLAIAGFVLLIAMLHLSRGIGWFQARMAEKMLVRRG